MRRTVAATILIVLLSSIGFCLVACDCLSDGQKAPVLDAQGRCDNGGCVCCALHIGFASMSSFQPIQLVSVRGISDLDGQPAGLPSMLYRPPRA
jgi:hypothetical protein